MKKWKKDAAIAVITVFGLFLIHGKVKYKVIGV
jgi:hypothetical protein